MTTLHYYVTTFLLVVCLRTDLTTAIDTSEANWSTCGTRLTSRRWLYLYFIDIIKHISCYISVGHTVTYMYSSSSSSSNTSSSSSSSSSRSLVAVVVVVVVVVVLVVVVVVVVVKVVLIVLIFKAICNVYIHFLKYKNKFHYSELSHMIMQQ